MAVPKKRTSKSIKGMRRSHHALVHRAAVSVCESCGEVKVAHEVCPNCGKYRGHQVLPPPPQG